MKVHLGTDHGAFDLKQFLVKELTAAGFDVVDHGASTYDASDDYPEFVLAAAEAVAADPGSLGIVLGTSGIGEAVAANKVPGVRAALTHDADDARLARDHVDANVLALGGRRQSLDDGLAMALVFLSTPFSNDVRHERRIALITDYEERDRG